VLARVAAPLPALISSQIPGVQDVVGDGSPPNGTWKRGSCWHHRLSMIVDRVHYVAGVRDLEPANPGDAGRLAEQAEGFVWVALSDPHADELGELGAAFDLPQVRVEPRRDRHERPKLETHGQITILTLKTVRHAPGMPPEPGAVDILVGGPVPNSRVPSCPDHPGPDLHPHASQGGRAKGRLRRQQGGSIPDR
jgi:hypothetical protein